MEKLLRLLGYAHVNHGLSSFYREGWELGPLTVRREGDEWAMYLDHTVDTPDGTHEAFTLLYRGNDRDVFTVLSEFHAPEDYLSPY